MIPGLSDHEEVESVVVGGGEQDFDEKPAFVIHCLQRFERLGGQVERGTRVTWNGGQLRRAPFVELARALPVCLFMPAPL